ncbi:hypothetical protein GDO81_011636 [Engystomops pustulosus]|uniref:HAT C-terminal dimerisation domain-containing protein n=1 Tax=Engystomops pustulosus TaxID=76066 RepID=A0AAV7BFP1_ENGPU|nr:hypothetical protein GDO81_011636 [Engystomops pustulosus]
MGKEEMPQSKFKPIMTLIKSLGNNAIKEKHINLHHCTLTEIESALSETIASDIENEIKRSPCISLLIDESTDIAVHHKMILYVRTVNGSVPQTHFWANLELHGECSADAIVNVLKIFLEKRGVSFTKILGLATDGAAVMIGRHNGVGKKLQARFPLMLHFHCIAHRMALAISQASEGISQLGNEQNLIGMLYSYFNSSTIRHEKLVKMQEVLEQSQISLKEIHSVRWLSLGRAVDALHDSFDAVILVLTDLVATKKRSLCDRAPGLLKGCSEYIFIATLCLLRDVLEVINRVSRVFQTEDINFSVLLSELRAVTLVLETMREAPGKYLAAFLSQMSASGGYFRDIKISYRSTSEAEFKNVKEKFLNNLLNNLSERFSLTDLSILCDLDQVLNPMSLPHNISKDDSLNNVIQKFCVPEAIASTYQCKLPSEEGLRKEWLEVSDLLKRYKGMKMTDFCQLLFSYKIGDVLIYPDFCAPASVALILPLSTACCERGFSTQNRIKSSKRSRLGDKHLEALSRISEEGPSVSLTNDTVECNFDFQAAVALWKQKTRRSHL